MRTCKLGLSTLLMAISIVSCSRNTANLEQELTTAMEQRRATGERGDADAYSKLIADDLVVIDDDGRYRNKASILEHMKPGRPPTAVHKISDVRVQISGELGIITYHLDSEDKIGNQSVKAETRELEIYRRQGGKWMLISRAIVPLPYPNRTPAKIDTSVYESYVGVYDFGDNFLLTVKKDGDKLTMFNSDDETSSNLLPFSNISFYQDKSVGVLTFVRDEERRVVGLEIWDQNSTVSGRKIK